MSDVGNALMLALRKDVNGACYGVFPDCPVMDLPNGNTPIFYGYAFLGQTLGKRLGLEVIGPIQLGVAVVAVFVGLHILAYILATLFGMIF